MRRLLTGYVVSFNLRHKRHGQLFQNRFKSIKSIVCQEDVYLKELIRYIHLNPLRAGLVNGIEGLDNTKQKSDLSRRAIIFNLHGLSLREYINFSLDKAYPVCSLEEILAKHQKITAAVCQEIKPLREFKQYLHGGYYCVDAVAGSDG